MEEGHVYWKRGSRYSDDSSASEDSDSWSRPSRHSLASSPSSIASVETYCAAGDFLPSPLEQGPERAVSTLSPVRRSPIADQAVEELLHVGGPCAQEHPQSPWAVDTPVPLPREALEDAVPAGALPPPATRRMSPARQVVMLSLPEHWLNRVDDDCESVVELFPQEPEPPTSNSRTSRPEYTAISTEDCSSTRAPALSESSARDSPPAPASSPVPVSTTPRASSPGVDADPTRGWSRPRDCEGGPAPILKKWRQDRRNKKNIHVSSSTKTPVQPWLPNHQPYSQSTPPSGPSITQLLVHFQPPYPVWVPPPMTELTPSSSMGMIFERRDMFLQEVLASLKHLCSQLVEARRAGNRTWANDLLEEIVRIHRLFEEQHGNLSYLVKNFNEILKEARVDPSVNSVYQGAPLILNNCKQGASRFPDRRRYERRGGRGR